VEEYPMFFITYLRRELRRRTRQAVFIALGLALGVGLVVTVAAASAGVNKAQSGVLSALYGVGTDITVTGNAPPPHYSSSGSNQPAKATPHQRTGRPFRSSPAAARRSATTAVA
jgi:putative ABC transport system permease protein